MSSDDETPLTPSSEDDVTQKTPKLGKSDVNFSFGPEKWYWTRCGHRWRFVRSSKSDWSALGIHDAWWVVFKHDTGFMIGGENEDGQGHIVHTWNDKYLIPAGEVDAFVQSRDAYVKLFDWICDQTNRDIEKVQDVSVSIGPKGSYFARCGKRWISHALPRDLQSIIEKQKDTRLPMVVALGVRNSWIVLWSDGTRNWDLRLAYPTLAQGDLLSSGTGEVVFVALNPYEEDRFFHVAKNGACGYSTSLSSKKESNILHEMTDEYMRLRAERDGTTFQFPWYVDGATKQVRITPDSYQEMGKLRSLVEGWKDRQGKAMRNNIALVGAVASGVGILSKVAGASTIRAAGVGASAGIGAVLTALYQR